MDTQGQIGIFFLYVAVGFVCGLVYEVFALCRLCFRGKATAQQIFTGVCDVTFWIVTFVITGIVAYFGRLPNLREYMWIGLLVGGILYLKTLRRIVAILEKLCYNKYKNFCETIKLRKNTNKKVDREV